MWFAINVACPVMAGCSGKSRESSRRGGYEWRDRKSIVEGSFQDGEQKVGRERRMEPHQTCCRGSCAGVQIVIKVGRMSRKSSSGIFIGI